MLLTLSQFDLFLTIMVAIAVVVFIVLYFVEAGYGKMISSKWGPAINNKVAWVLMECPVFIVLFYMWMQSDRQWNAAPFVFFLLFELHYFQRSFIFPMLLKGKSRMPLSIILMGAVFNTLNGLMQGGWLFYISPENRYPAEWLGTWQFIAGTIIFATGFFLVSSVFISISPSGLRTAAAVTTRLPAVPAAAFRPIPWFFLLGKFYLPILSQPRSLFHSHKKFICYFRYFGL